jgi:hypothetical protein
MNEEATRRVMAAGSATMTRVDLKKDFMADVGDMFPTIFNKKTMK